MGLNEQLSEISKELKELKEEKEQKKPKPFKIPFWKKTKGRDKKKNYVTVIKANENGHGEFLKEQINEQTVMIDGIPRLATAEYIINIKRNPIIVIPSWSVQPINWKELCSTSLADGSNVAGYKLLLNAMKLSGVEGKKKGMNPVVLWIIGGLVVAGIIYALVTGKI
jgi:hypothetical protein